MTNTDFATQADYGDALLTARRAKGVLFALLLLFLLVQVVLFFLARYTDHVIPRGVTTPPVAQQPAEASPVTGEVAPIDVTLPQEEAAQVIAMETARHTFFRWIIGMITFGGIILGIVFSMVMLLILLIMLVGRLIGVSQVTSAWIWTVILVLGLFPWQAFLVYPHVTGADFRIPGVLYTWAELVQNAHFTDFTTDRQTWGPALMGWARFVGFPVIALVILLMVQARSSRALRRALGEAPVEPRPSGDFA